MGIDKPIEIAGIKFCNRLMNGAYIGSKSLEDIEKLINSECGAVTVGSITVRPRRANSGQNYWTHKERFYALNSYGMPNGGAVYFRKNLPKIAELVHASGRPLIANLAGFSKEEFGLLIKLAEDSGADMAELNFGCPNVWVKGQQKTILSYHAGLMQETLAYIANQKPTIKLCVKISPLPPDLLADIAKVGLVV